MTIDWNAVEKEAVGLLSKYLQINTVNPPGNEIRISISGSDLGKYLK